MATLASQPRLYVAYVAVVTLFGALITTTHLDQAAAAAHEPAFWMMFALSVLAGARAFLTPDARGTTMVICPTLCFTFAIQLCWGLGPAIVTQAAATAVVTWRLRSSVGHGIGVMGQYVLAFAAANVVLSIGNPHPFADNTATDLLRDALTVAGAAAAWLGTYCLAVLTAARLKWGAGRWRHATESLGYQTLFKAALLLLSPLLAVSAHINAAFVPLIFVPLYAVERMARLSAERDRATRLDPVTGLANRGGLQGSFEDQMASSDRATMALLLLDLDRFKYINDTLGHEMGDRLLAAVAKRIASAAPAGGVVARLGGDEFAILAAGLRDREEAQALASHVAATLAEPVVLDDLQVDITASIGVALCPGHGDDFPTLMRHADVAMYDAKQRGDSTAFYQADSDHNCPHRLSLLSDLRQSLQAADRSQITLHYQPQVALDTGQVLGVEALLRWRHPVRGAVPTQELLQVAEHTAVMHLITQRVIDDVLAQVAAWSAAGLTLRVSLNVSARDLYSGGMVAHLSSQLAHYAVSPSQIQLEITESALMADPTRALSTLTQVSALGIPMALDDFGTGYSSLQHLRKLPFAEIKIDRSFVAGMAHNSDDAAIVRSTVELARALGLRTVAEGVENEYTWRLLADMGCSVGQGWYTAYPMPGDEVAGWLARYPAAPVSTR